MQTKGERTRAHILELVAPVFNRQGYYGTSLTEITNAIGLTKGAVYGNFESKEHLAVEAFNYNLRKIIFPLSDLINAETSALQKLKVIPAYYREYYQRTRLTGGCPILNVGIDSNNQNPELAKRVKDVMMKLIQQMAAIIEFGITNNEFNPDLAPIKVAKQIYSTIEGAVFTTTMLQDEQHLLDMMNYLDSMIDNEITIQTK